MSQKVIKLNPDEFSSLLVQFERSTPEPSSIPPGSKLIDVSHHQAAIDWVKVRNVARVDYAMIRATNGTQNDTRFAFNWQAAKAAGVKRGAYHYWQNEIGATNQAQVFIASHNGDFGELPWALDIEDQTPPFTKAELADVRTFLDMVELQTGKRGLIYTGRSVWNFPGETWATDYQLWLAAYSVSGYQPLAPWPQPCIWQHTSRGEIPGITANTVDLNTAGDGLTPIKPDWYWRGCTTEQADDSGGRPPVFFVRSKSNPLDIHDTPRGQVRKKVDVTWRMTVSNVTADGWLLVYKDKALEWWVKSGDVNLSN